MRSQSRVEFPKTSSRTLIRRASSTARATKPRSTDPVPRSDVVKMDVYSINPVTKI